MNNAYPNTSNRYTVPNQKTITIHRDKPDKDFISIKNSHWMEINKKFSPYGLQVYLYLAKNMDGYDLSLSQTSAELEAGIKKTTFHKYINLFIAEGYIVKRSGNRYDFYETPHDKPTQEGNENNALNDGNNWSANDF